MLLAEIIRSCSHAKVAEAAVTSIGPETARDIERRAHEQGLDSGSFVANVVQNFARTAGATDWQRLARRIQGADMPILTGLLHILETSLPQGAEREMHPCSTAAHVLFEREHAAHMRCCA